MCHQRWLCSNKQLTDTQANSGLETHAQAVLCNYCEKATCAGTGCVRVMLYLPQQRENHLRYTDDMQCIIRFATLTHAWRMAFCNRPTYTLDQHIHISKLWCTCMSTCMCICMCVYVYVYMYAWMHTSTYIVRVSPVSSPTHNRVKIKIYKNTHTYIYTSSSI